MSILFKSCYQVSVANFEKKAKSIHSFCKVQVWNNFVKIYGNTGWQPVKARKGHAEDHLPFRSLKLSGKVLKYFSPLWHFSFFIGHLIRPLEIGLMVARKTKGSFWFIKEKHQLFSTFIKKCWYQYHRGQTFDEWWNLQFIHFKYERNQMLWSCTLGIYIDRY